MKKNLWICFALLLCSYLSKAQDPRAAIGFSPNPFVQHFQKGTAINFEIGLPQGMPSTTWFYCAGNAAADCVPTTGAPSSVSLAGGLTLTFATTKVTLSGTLPVGSTDQTYYFSLLANDVIGLNTRSYRIVVRDARDLVFVLDRSGSMECSPSAATATTGVGNMTWPGCTTNPTKRWQLLRDATNNFVQKLDDLHTVADDRMSVVYFAGDAINGGLVNNDALPFKPISDFKNAPGILADMSAPPVIAASGELARNGTSIGSGLQKGFERFTHDVHPNSKKILFLFSDGEQNTSKAVKESGMNAYKTIQDGQANPANPMPFPNDITIYTSALVATTPATTLMNNISTNNNYYNVMIGNEIDFPRLLSDDAFNKIYGAFSPQMIRFDKQVLNYGQTTASTFECNKNVNRVIFEAYFDEPLGNNLKYRVLKDGVDVTRFGKILTSGDYIHTLAFNMYELRDIKSEGKWTFELLGASDNMRNKNVRLFATADDHAIKFDGGLSSNKVQVGDAMIPTVKLFENGKAVKGATVKAVILKPGDDIGDVLARTQTNALPTPTKETGTCADQKYSYLQANNPAALAKLKMIQETALSLTDQGNGIYSGKYTDVNVSGTYKVRYIVNYTSPQLGHVERMIEQTVNVTFPKLDWPKTVPQKAAQTTRDNISFLSLNFKPTYTIGGQTRYVGPGFKHAFGVSGNAVGLSQVEDNCDGSYSLTLSGRDLSKRVDIYLTDKVIYSGRAKDILTGERGMGLSVHGGFTFPTDSLGRIYKTGVYAEGDLSYRIKKELSVELVGGYYSFKSNYNILAANFCVKGHLPMGNDMEATLALGFGRYKPQNSNMQNGTMLRLNAGKLLLNKRVLAGFDLSYHSIKGYNMKFLTLGVGAKLYL